MYNAVNTAYAGLGQASAEKAAYAGEPIAQNSLMRLADQIAEATARIGFLADNLNGLALGLHGPRPEPVSDQPAQPNADSFSARVGALLSAVERAQRAYDGVVR